MAWIVPVYSREQVNVAGRTRVSLQASDEARDIVVGVINNWRSAHSFPLNCFQMTLRGRARQVHPRALIAQRLKRLVAIEAKLRRFTSMKLSQMQDIGGCRAILPNVSDVERLVALYKQTLVKNPSGRHQLIHEDDYIVAPKADGYRGVHLIYRYHSRAKKHKGFNDLKVEIQLRSRLQHAWATAVETVDVFTGQALKSDQGQQEWERFFALMGTAIALKERRPTVPNTPTDRAALVSEVRTLENKLRIIATLDAWRYSIRWLTPEKKKSKKDAPYFFVLFLNPDDQTIEVHEFKFVDLVKAQAKYGELEERVQKQPTLQAVLVSVERLSQLKTAYPNYFLDTRGFLNEVKRVIS